MYTRRIQVNRSGLYARPSLGSQSIKAGAIWPFFLSRILSAKRIHPLGFKAARRWRQWQLLPWLVLVIGIPASVFLFTALYDAVEDVAHLRFERQASDATGVIDRRIHSYSNVLYGLRALFATHGEVNRVQFHLFVKALDLTSRYPGFDVVNYAAYVPAHDVDRFVQSVRRDTSLESAGYPDFAIKPAGVRPEYFVVAYLEPMTGYEFAFGRDLGANPRVAEPEALVNALHSARDTGKLTASGVPIRITTGKEYVGLALRLPVYRLGLPLDTIDERRAAYFGSVGAGFNIEELMRGVLNNETLRRMRFTLYDVGAVGQSAESANRRLLFDSNQLLEPSARIVDTNADSAFIRVLPIEVGGRTWQITFETPKQKALYGVDKLLPWAVLIGGIMSSLLLCGVLFSLGSSRSRAIKIAGDMTKNLRASEAQLRESQALLNDAQKLSHVGCSQYSPADGRVVWSEELYRIHGVDPQTFIPTYQSALELVHPDDRAVWQEVRARAMTDGLPFTSEFRIVRPDGTVRYLRSLGEVITGADGLISRVLSSVLDITEQKQTEDALRASAQQLTALSRRLVEVQEAERRKLSRELHDRVGQNLTALSINLDILRTSLAGDGNSEHRARLSDSSALLESTADSIEDVMCELRPPMLDDYGLLPALHWYAREFSKRTGIAVDVHGTEHMERADPDIEIALFRISQEALNNVAKHARARQVRIELDHPNGYCALTISDDGIGIERALDAAGRQRSGLGMITMRERAEALGGRFTVESQRTGGTSITVEIPS